MGAEIPQIHCPISEVFHQLNVIDIQNPVEPAAGPGANDLFDLSLDHTTCSEVVGSGM